MSSSFNVAAGAASKMVFTTLPTTATHGKTFAVILSVEDALGNIVTADNTGTITLSLGSTHPAGAVLSGTLTEKVVDGVATFSNLSLNDAGSYLVDAVDNFKLASIASAVFKVA